MNYVKIEDLKMHVWYLMVTQGRKMSIVNYRGDGEISYQDKDRPRGVRKIPVLAKFYIPE